MHYELYVDRIFIFHFIMNFLLLLMTARMCGYQAGRKRLAGCAAAGAIFFLVILIVPLGNRKLMRVIKTAVMLAGYIGMLQLAFRFHDTRELLRAGLYYALSSCAFGGVLEAVNGIRRLYFPRAGSEGLLGKGAMSGILVPSAACAAGSICLLGWERRRRKNSVYAVKLMEGETVVQVTALMDSGNSLYDPISGRPVCIIEDEIFRRLGLFEKPERFRIIPYHSIGKKNGLLKAAAVEMMYLQKEGQEQKKSHVLLAVSGQRLCESGRYQMLLHPALLEEEKGENNDIESSDAGQDAV